MSFFNQEFSQYLVPSGLRSVPCEYREMRGFALRSSDAPALSPDVKLMPAKSEKPLSCCVSIELNLWVHRGVAEA